MAQPAPFPEEDERIDFGGAGVDSPVAEGAPTVSQTHSILIVEDEQSIASFVSLYLKNAGYGVRAVTTGAGALNAVATEMPALIILDLNLPDMDGVEICRRIRKGSDVPILMLTARDEDVDKIIGLEVGADDYLTKPFNPRELVARVKSVLRRSTADRRIDEGDELRHGELVINSGRREVLVGDDEIQLAPKEFDLLWELLDHRGIVLTRDQLLERVWGYTFAGDTRTVDVHVRQIRRKLGDASPIVTVWGVGYKVATDRQPFPPDSRAPSARPRTVLRSYASPVPRSLRFRLPALFLLGIVLGGLVAAAIALRLFQDLGRDRSFQELSREATGITQLYADAALRAAEEGAAAPDFAAQGARVRDRRPLVLRRGTRVPRPGLGLTGSRRPPSRPRVLDLDGQERVRVLAAGRRAELSRGLGAAPARTDAEPLGAIIVAKPEAVLRNQWVPLLKRLLVAFGLGIGARGPGRVVDVTSHHEARAVSSRMRPTRSRQGTTASAFRSGRSRTRSVIWPSGSTRWQRGSVRRRSASDSF